LSKDDLLNHLRELEVALHQPSIRSDPDRLEDLLHESFTEFGRSGRSYSKIDTVRQLPSEQLTGTIWSQDFSVAEIADGVALLTYKSGHLDGKVSRHTLRSSIWLRTADGWQMRFHQGTAIAADPKRPISKLAEK
jgi:hypothetical protein